jgi:hypothetical protein
MKIAYVMLYTERDRAITPPKAYQKVPFTSFTQVRELYAVFFQGERRNMVKELNCSKFQIYQPVRVTAAGKWQDYRGTVRSTYNGIVDVDFGERSPFT